MNHIAAFQCADCPRNNDPARGRSCPAWWEWASENPGTGETKIERMCGWAGMPIFLVHVLAASNRPAAAIESTRNEIAKGLGDVAGQLAQGFARLQLPAGNLPPAEDNLPAVGLDLPPLDGLEG